jgi:hypothetical protein
MLFSCVVFFFFFLVGLGFKLRASLEPLHQTFFKIFFMMGIFELESLNYFPGLASNHDLPDLYLLTS